MATHSIAKVCFLLSCGLAVNSVDFLDAFARERCQKSGQARSQGHVKSLEPNFRQLRPLKATQQQENDEVRDLEIGDTETRPGCNLLPPAAMTFESEDPINEDFGLDLTSAEFEIANSGILQTEGEAGSDPLQETQLFEGDIEVSAFEELVEAYVPTRNAIRSLRKRWPTGIVPYKIAADLPPSARLALAAGILQFHRTTCLRFIPRTLETDYVYVIASTMCSSSIGRQGSRQIVRLSPRCYTPGIVAHELMHAVGFWHEHTRTDRDDHVTIIWENIQPGMRHNFARRAAATVQHFGAEYDYGSVMHYSFNHFSRDPSRPTIIPRIPGVSIGQRIGLSSTDAFKINALYECSSASVTTPFNNCQDRHRDCEKWSRSGECHTNPAWMTVHCRHSCALCDDPCSDDHVHCPFWAESGECISNMDYMLRACKRSCHTCLPKGYTPTCLDRSRYCQLWALSGQCVSNPGYMLINCQKSCEQC